MRRPAVLLATLLNAGLGRFSKVYVYNRTRFRRVASTRKVASNARSHNRALWRSCW